MTHLKRESVRVDLTGEASRPPVLLLFLGLVLTVAPVAAEAQEAPAGNRAAQLADVLMAVNPESRLRVAVDRGVVREGMFVRSSAGMLRLRLENRTIEIPYGRIDSVWTGRTRTAEAAAIGGLAGAGAGALITWGVNRAICDSPTGACDPPPASTWALMIGGGALAGAGIGAAIGSGTVSWEIAFP